MSLLLKAFQSTLETKEGDKLWYPRIVKLGKTVSTRELGVALSKRSSLSVGDARSLVEDSMDIIREFLLDGKSVCLEGLGTFTITCQAKGTGVKNKADVNPSQVTHLKMRFTPTYTRSNFAGVTRAMFEGARFEMLDKYTGRTGENSLPEENVDDGGTNGGNNNVDPDA